MAWFDDLKAALPAYYPGGTNEAIVGYVRGNASPQQWRSMIAAGYQQMLILGSAPPTAEEWQAAGVGQRGAQTTIHIHQLNGFIVLYGGFMYRPWGKIFNATPDALSAFPGSLQSWKRNYMPPRRRP